MEWAVALGIWLAVLGLGFGYVYWKTRNNDPDGLPRVRKVGNVMWMDF